MSRYGERTRIGEAISGFGQKFVVPSVQYGVATGGSAISPDPVIDGVTYRVLEFTASGTLTVTSAGAFDVIAVGGGGASGVWECSGTTGGSKGGGGGGGFVQQTVNLTTNATVVVGAGSAATAQGGGFSEVAQTSGAAPSVFAIGGYTDQVRCTTAATSFPSNTPGCGGGGNGTDFSAGTFAGARGFQGGNGGSGQQGRSGGGGGAGANGGNAVSAGASGAGGAGKEVNTFIGGASLFKAGGGGGGGSTTGGAGGAGGGGAGSTANGGGTAGSVNSGGGGGGGRATSSGTWTMTGTGGSGIVYVRFKV